MGHIRVIHKRIQNEWVRDYENYCANLIEKTANEVSLKKRYVFLMGKQKYWNFSFRPTIKVAFQFEHTLVRSGGRDTAGAPLGSIKVASNPKELDTENYLVRVQDIDQFIDSDIVIDYSHPNRINIENCESTNWLAEKYCVLSPLIYEANASDAKDRAFETITFFVNPEEPRRKAFLNALSDKKINSQNINNVKENIDSIYRNTKILVNIHQTDHHHTFEELRVLPALQCGCIVISERSPLTASTGYEDFVLWADLKDIPEVIRDVQKHYRHYWQKLFGEQKLTNVLNSLASENNFRMKEMFQKLNLS